MARYSILSKPVSFTLPYLAALLTSALPAPAQTGPEPTQPPLVVPYRPLLAATDGWQQEGVLIDHSIAAAGPNAWLAAYSYLPSGTPLNNWRVSTVLRMIRANQTPPPPMLLPDVLDAGFSAPKIIQTLPGEQGAWALWRSEQGVKAWWISATSGEPVGQPLILPGFEGITEFQVAGDGQTGWIVSSSWLGSSVVTLTANSGPPRITGSTNLPGSFPASRFTPMAAHQGKLLMLQYLQGSPRIISGITVNAAAVISPPVSWPEALIVEYNNSYGLMGYGEGWMMIYSSLVTPLLPGRLVMGLELSPGGLPGQAPAKALFVAPDNSNPNRKVISNQSRGAILTTSESSYLTRAGFAFVLEKDAADKATGTNLFRFGQSTDGFPNFRGELPIAASLRGNHLAVMESHEETAGAFTQTLHVHDFLASPFNTPTSYHPVNNATGLQEEPALAWLPDAAVVSWQQISTAVGGSSIIQRLYRSGNTSTDLVFAGTTNVRLSSPDVAVNQTRMLMVAKQPNDNDTGADPEDVAGILIENGQAITGPFKIGYGPGSQRAACAAPYHDGFCVVWREELYVGTPNYESRIRLTILDRNGFPTQPGGITVATSSVELSSPGVAVKDNLIGIVWKEQTGSMTRVVARAVFGNQSPLDIFPGAFTTSSPDIIASGDGFLITARGEGGMINNEILAANFGYNGTSSVALPAPSVGLVQGREPAFAALAEGATALFWLNHRSGGRFSTQIWMAVCPFSGAPFGSPVVVRTGEFERDTLVAKGDGKGRVLLAVKSLAMEDTGVRVFLLAPGIHGVPVLSLTTTNSPALLLKWPANLLFPASASIVEASPDLKRWYPASTQLTPLANGLDFQLPGTTLTNQYFRLRAGFSGN